MVDYEFIAPRREIKSVGKKLLAIANLSKEPPNPAREGIQDLIYRAGYSDGPIKTGPNIQIYRQRDALPRESRLQNEYIVRVSIALVITVFIRDDQQLAEFLAWIGPAVQAVNQQFFAFRDPAWPSESMKGSPSKALDLPVGVKVVEEAEKST